MILARLLNLEDSSGHPVYIQQIGMNTNKKKRESLSDYYFLLIKKVVAV
jgi:hypothetical protein